MEEEMQDMEQQRLYSDNCQQVLSDISSVKGLVNKVKEIEDIYCPRGGLNLFKIDDNLTDSMQVLHTKLSDCIHHLDHLSERVSDTSSKVLVTGDLNSGKSTLVNALLKGDILPVDQQPCTSIFCEVVSFSPNQDMPTTVHAIKDVTIYDKQNEDTYHPLELRHLYNLLTSEEQHYKMLKIYTSRNENLTEQSLLYNGLVDIALIDSPGLNTDSVKTTAVFAREEEIDVVVFVVSAENHFTLSGKEFLWNAANEKTHIFIVVNRFDNIRDKDRCKRLILEQIKQLSPVTYEQADHLIHFVSAENEANSPDFVKLEQKLRAFVLNNRISSKLLPANTYLTNVLRDIYFISTTNESSSTEKFEKASALESEFLSTYTDLVQAAAATEKEVTALKESTMTHIQANVTTSLESITRDGELDTCIQSIQYPGLLLTWQYAQDIVDSLSSRLEANLEKVEQQASQEAIHAMQAMNESTRQLNTDITTKIHENIMTSKSHRPIHIKIEARDLLLNRKIVDDKKIAISALATVSATTVFLKAINIKDIAWSLVSRYINPLNTNSSHRFATFTLSTVGMLGLGWTAYSFVSVIPHALQTNLKAKFQTAVKNENLVDNQTHRITQAVEHVLEAKQTEILFRVKQMIAEKKEEKDKLEQSVFRSATTLNHFKALVSQSDALLLKVEQSLNVPQII
ncbi:P-loop containing nucleoside triphosphate hydrolase protein [Mucor mucedo]|uniref:P-loop containing nucleoside triphosphate hydrolase protein n=1 Tax=Mucor mucedo TaxID=29922 RepID=UPI00221E5A36|nr:P-loop containing nucleoside triphosphate hydrolase protein [Mucor mucedo]KAI7895924.1 P-loop containing nucleoside triphosphate hydrolase protein [Mucor mucedo]